MFMQTTQNNRRAIWFGISTIPAGLGIKAAQ